MKVDELKPFLLHMDKWVRKNKNIIGKPVRTKHFLEDLSLIVYLFEEEGFHPKVIKWKREDIPRKLVKLFGITRSNSQT